MQAYALTQLNVFALRGFIFRDIHEKQGRSSSNSGYEIREWKRIFCFQYSIFNIQTSIFNLQTSIFNIQTSIFNIQTSIFNIQTSIFNIQTSTLSYFHYLKNYEGANGGTQLSVNSNFSAKYQLTTIFLANSQLTTNFGQLLTFTFLQQILFCHNPNFLYFSTSITFSGRP